MIGRRALLRAAAGSLVIGTALHQTAWAEASPTATVSAFYDVLLKVMKDAQKLGFDGRYKLLDPAVRKAFNLELMTRLAIGAPWQNIPEPQQKAIAEAFSQYSVSTYANRFDGYGGEKFNVEEATTQSAGGTVVKTQLIQGDGKPIALDYLMRQTDGDWKIIDVFLSGTVSELATRRSEFSSVLRQDGGEGLLKLLQQRVDALKHA